MTAQANTFTYAGRTLSYSARFSGRSTLEISVLPDGAVEVVAPTGTRLEEIEARLRKRGKWILAQQRFFHQFRPRTPARRFVGGETHLYLGRQYRLRLSPGPAECVKLKGGYFCIETQDPHDSERVRELLQCWYDGKAKIKLHERYSMVTQKFQRFIPEIPSLSIRRMKRRWGSYSGSGRIILNMDLIRAPLPCIDYVVAHEIAHVVYQDHSRDFYELLEAVMPNWENRKERLERVLA